MTRPLFARIWSDPNQFGAWGQDTASSVPRRGIGSEQLDVTQPEGPVVEAAAGHGFP